MEEKFNGTEGEVISLESASEMTERYRESTPKNDIKAHFIGKKALRELLRQRGCVGIRIYYGLDADNEQQLVLVGTNSQGDDMLRLIYDKCAPCPDQCSNPNPLNS